MVLRLFAKMLDIHSTICFVNTTQTKKMKNNFLKSESNRLELMHKWPPRLIDKNAVQRKSIII